MVIVYLLTLLRVSQGHKRASSDVSIASSEDEKIPLSPSILESVPEKAEPAPPSPAAPETPQSPDAPEPHALISTSFVEEPITPAAEEPPEETVTTPVEQEVPGAAEEVSSPEVELPEKEMQQLEITAQDEKEDDTVEPLVDTASAVEGSEVTETTVDVEELNTPEDKVEDPYENLKVTLTLPKEENGEKPTDKDHIVSIDDKQVPDKAKDEKERDSDSGTGSASEKNSVDLNLSISSFLSKAKDPGSVSVQVTHTASM